MILYFSGTGNSRNIAELNAKEELVSINRLLRNQTSAKLITEASYSYREESMFLSKKRLTTVNLNGEIRNWIIGGLRYGSNSCYWGSWRRWKSSCQGAT
ncbi:hypothetical protein [Enterococcus sp. DIV0756]|uniref:hypothetical protein n=1 Tax=Enterococcus sp. DIV0756 TaxID=2774636 RepID=UPI003F6831EE